MLTLKSFSFTGRYQNVHDFNHDQRKFHIGAVLSDFGIAS